MAEYLARRRDGAPLALLEAADAVDAQLYGHRHLKGWDGRLVEVDSLEEATAKLAAAYGRRGLNPAQASIAAEDTLARLRPHRVKVPHQQAELLADSRTPTRKPPTAIVGLQEGDGRKALEASWRRLHPEFTDRQIEIAIGG